MTPTIASFEEKGWFLSQEGIDLIASENPEANTLDDFINCAKDMDLRLLTAKGFNKTATKVSEIPSPLVLQVLEVNNVAMPSVNQVENPRLLKVVFTDGGKKKFNAAEVFDKVESLKLHTPPGTKFLVTKPIEIKDQFMILGPGMLKELGGHVQELVQVWRSGKQFLKRFNGKSAVKDGEDGTEQGPPAFVPFKVKPNRGTDQLKISEKSKKKPEDQKDSATEKKGRKKKTNKAENKKPVDRKVPKAEDKRAVETNQQVADSQNSNDASAPKKDTKRNAPNKREKKVKTKGKDDSDKTTEKKAENINKKLVEFKERSSKKNAGKPIDTASVVATREQEEPVIAVPEKKERSSIRKERKEIKEPRPIPDAHIYDTTTPPSDSHVSTEKKSNRKKKMIKNLDQQKPQQSLVDSVEQKSSEQRLPKKEAIKQQAPESQPLDKSNGKSVKPQRKERPSKKEKEPISALNTVENLSKNAIEQHLPNQQAIEQQAPESQPLDKLNGKSAKPQRKEKLSKKKKEPIETDTQKPATSKLQDVDSNSKSEKKVKKDKSKKKGDKSAVVEEQANGPSTTIDAQPENNIKKPRIKKATSKRSSQINVSDESRSTTPKSEVSTTAEKKPAKQKLRQPKQPKRRVNEEEAENSVPTTTVSEPIRDHQRVGESTEESTPMTVSKKDVYQKNSQQQAAPATSPPLPPPAFSSSFNSTPSHTTASEVPHTNYVQQVDNPNTRYSTTYYNTPSHHQQPQQAQDYYYHHPQDPHHPPVQQQQAAMYAPMVDYSMMVPIDPNTGMPAGMYSYPPPQQQPQHQPYMQPMYYMSDQLPTYYANHQPHYTQLYDEAHYDHHYGSYGGRGGVYNNTGSTTTRGGLGGQSRGGYKQS